MKNIGLRGLTASKWARLMFIFLGTGIILLAPYIYLLKPAYSKSKAALRETEAKLISINKAIPSAEKKLSKIADKKSKQAKMLEYEIKMLPQQEARLGQLKNELTREAASSKIKVQFTEVTVYIVLALAILSFLFFLKLCPSGSKKSVIRTLTCSFWTAAPTLLLLLIASFFILDAYTSKPSGSEYIVPVFTLILFGALIIVTAIFIPSRAEKSFDSASWRFSKSTLGSVLIGTFWTISGVLFFFMGSYTVEQKPDGKLALSKKKLFRHGLYVLLFIVILWSAVGILMGNAMRILYYFMLSPQSPGGWYLIWAVTITVLALLAYVKAWKPGFLSKFSLKARGVICPQCSRKLRSIIPCTFQQSFLLLGVCKNCGCIVDRLGKKTDYKIRTKHVLKLLAVTIPVTLVSIIISSSITAFSWNFIGNISLANAKQDLRSAGFSYERPSNKPKPADKDNAVYWFKKAGDSLEKSLKPESGDKFYNKKTEEEFLGFFFDKVSKGSITGEELAYAKKFVRKHEKSLNLFEEGASKKIVHWGIDQSKPWPEREIPKYAYFISLGKLVCIKAVVEAENGNIQRSAETIKSGLIFAGGAGTEPELIAKMIRLALYNISLKTAKFIFPKISPSEAKRLWNPYLKPDEILSDFRKTMQLELLCSGEWVAQLSCFDKQYWEGDFGSMIGMIYWPFLKLDVASHYRAIKHDLEALQMPYSKYESKMENAEDNFRRKVWLLGQISHPNFANLYSNTLVTVAYMRLAKTAMEAQLYKQKNGRWPEAVWEMVTDAEKEKFFDDPFTGGKLRIRKYKSGIMLYSVGPDMADDQSAEYDRRERKGDVTWFLK